MQALKNTKLEAYADWLSKKQEGNRKNTPAELGVKTLWVPEFSGNRTAQIDLNHRITGVAHGELWGSNGNCDTDYLIIEVPLDFDETKLTALYEKVCERLGKTSGVRVLRADRVQVIKEEIDKFYAQK